MSITDSETRVASSVHHGHARRLISRPGALSARVASGSRRSHSGVRGGIMRASPPSQLSHFSLIHLRNQPSLRRASPAHHWEPLTLGWRRSRRAPLCHRHGRLGRDPLGYATGIRRGALGCPSAPLGRHPRGVPNKPRGGRVTDQPDSSTRDFSLIRRFPVGKTHATPNASDCRLEPSDG